MAGMKAEKMAGRVAAVESKVGGVVGDHGPGRATAAAAARSEVLSEGIQTDGTLALIKGLTITLHMREDSSDDLVMRADLSGDG